MANGFHGSEREWNELQAPFLEIDGEIAMFARTQGMKLSKNDHEWPERSLRWSSNGMNRLIQIYLSDEKVPRYCLWICAYQDRNGARLWKQAFMKKDAPWSSVREDLTESLSNCFDIVNSWKPSDLGPVTS